MSDSISKHHQWREIEDLSPDVDPLRDRELEALHDVWVREKLRFVDAKQASDFNTQFAREWSIETGIIEGVYTLDRGITQTLIERGIDSAYIPHGSTNRNPELVARTIQAHADVLEGLFSFVKCDRLLSTSYIKELHASLLRYEDTVTLFDQNGNPFEGQLQKGTYKTMPNNPLRTDGRIHEYSPPEHVASEMDRLIQFHREHLNRRVAPHIEAAWLHHAFTQIHPFQDGNGRVARAIATLVFVKGEFFPLVVTRDDRERYIDALEAADQGDLSHLCRLFAQLQKRALTKAIGRSIDIKPVSTVEEALHATRDMLVDLGRIIPKEYLNAKSLASALGGTVALPSLQRVADSLTADIAQVDSSFQFGTANLGGPPNREILAVAEKLKYDPDVSHYHLGYVVTLKAGSVTSKIVITFHGVGSAFRGLLVAVCYFEVENGTPIPLSEDVFRISYQETLPEITQRFQTWLDGCIIEGIAQWRRTLV